MKAIISKIATIIFSATAISLPTLWLLEQQLKYALFFFEVSFIVLLSVVCSEIFDVNFKFAAKISTYFFDYVLIASSLSLFLLNFCKVHTIANIILAIITSSFLPGYVFLRLLNFHCLHSRFENFILSFALSLPLTCIISSVLVPISGQAALISIIYLFLSFLPIVKNEIKKRSKLTNETPSKAPYYELSRVLLIGLIILFFSFTLSQLYPQMTWVGNADISRHYSDALLFSKFPSSLSFTYPFFIVLESTIIELAQSSMIIVKTALAYMSITVVLSFYMMANAYLKKIDNRLPIIATISWFLFSGFGWLYFLQEKLAQLNMSQMDTLLLAFDKSYADIGYGISTNLWLWFLPMTVSFTMFFTLLYLMKRTDIPKRSFIPIFSLIIIALFFIHISELVMFVLLLLVLSLFTPEIKLRLQDALLSTQIGLAGVILLTIFYSILGISLRVSNYLTSIMFIATFSSYLLVSRGWKGFHSDKGWKIVVIAVAVLLILFFGGLLAWLPSAASFSMKYVSEIQFIPWLFYSVRLGIIGVLSLIGVTIVAKKYCCESIVLFVCLLFSALCLGRVVSIINLYQSTAYWEWRFLFFIFAAASMLAPIVILRKGKIREKIIPCRGLFLLEGIIPSRELFLSTLLLGIIIFSGFSSTYLTIELRVRELPGPMPRTEADAVIFLSNLLDKNIASSLLTIPESSSTSFLVPCVYTYSNLLPMIWASNYPEVPLNILYNQKFPDTYIYLQEKDLDTLHDKYTNGYVAQHLLQQSPEVFKNSEVQIYNLLEGVPPTSNSKTVLVMPFNNRSDNNYFPTYDILSLGGYNYTVMLDSDPNILKSDIILIPFDKSTQAMSKILNYLYTSDGKKLVVLNTDGYGPLAGSFFEGNTEVMLSTNSSDANLHIASNYTTASAFFDERPLGNNIEFTIDNDQVENDPLVIADDNQTGFWSALLESANSSIVLTNDAVERIKGTDSLQQTWSLSHGDWAKIYHTWNSYQNWSNREFLSFYWKGGATGKRIEAGIYAPDSGNMHRWLFYDNFTGWRRVIFPLNKSTEGRQVGSPDLTRVMQLEFFVDLEGQFAIDTTWYLDRVLIDVGQWIDVRVVLTDKNAFTKLLSFNGLAYVPLPINASEEILRESLYFLDGSKADELYGEGEVAKVSAEEIEDGYQLALSLKMPPEDGLDSETGGISQSRFKIEFTVEGFHASQIVGTGSEIGLPIEVEVFPSSVKNDAEALGWYVNGPKEAAFAARKLIGKSEIIYVTVYPLIKAILSDEKTGRSLYSALASLLDVVKIDIPKYDRHVISWIMDDAIPLFIFREATLNGNVNVESMSLFFPYDMNLERVDIKTDEHELSLRNVASISVKNGDNFNVSAREIKIGGGRGFYSSLVANNSEIAISGDDIRLSMKLLNGSIVEINGGLEVKLSIQGLLQVYVRDPRIQNDGNSTFKEAYAIHSYLAGLRTLGQDLSIQGYVKFDLPISDEYSFTSEFTWSGLVERQPPLLQWDEMGSFIESTPWLVAAFFIVIYFLYPYRPSQKSK